MRQNKFSTSTNIIRDSEKSLKYTPTPNAKKLAEQILNDFQKGIHSFTLIGSYGTGKSTFLWAFEQDLNGNAKYFEVNPKFKSYKFLHWVGQYESFIDYSSEQLHVKNDLKGNQNILDGLYQEYEEIGDKGLLVIMVDEFGKFLEYATDNNPDKELYFIQQLSEFVNDPDRNILLITTLHQNFDAYSYGLDQSQRIEWRKVKGRLKELTFNEPVEQLIYLAAEEFDGINNPLSDQSNELIDLIKRNYLFSINVDFLYNVGNKLYPLDPISAIVLTKALQYYGQNERSLFTFLNTYDLNEKPFHLAEVCQYIHHEFYWFINSKNNPHYRQWSEIRSAIERAEATLPDHQLDAAIMIQAIGLLHIFKSDAAKINYEFLYFYGQEILGIDNVEHLLKLLERQKIIIYTKFKDSYKLFEGSDLDIEEALQHAEKSLNEGLDIVAKLKSHFDFPIITAKAISYKKGTPRLFEFEISEEPINKIPEGEIDGYINLIVDPKLDLNDLEVQSAQQEEAILYGYFSNTNEIRNTLFDIERTKKVIEENSEDKVARKELENILRSHEQLLSHYVLDSLYSDRIEWFFNGKKKTISTKSDFNRLLSKICEDVYSATPTFNNELVNKHKISSSIHTARRNFFDRLVNNWNEPELGFEDDKFPPEKTIYQSLLKKAGMHITKEDVTDLYKPAEISSFLDIWKACDNFLETAKDDKRKLSELVDILSKKPYKLKQGLIDFWLPTYLFIKRGDFALYGDSGYIPEINESLLYLITRNIKEYEIKAFEISGLRLKLFNKYRDLLQLKNQDRISNTGFVESIKPFLIFYKNLPEYSKKTKRLSSEAIKFRKALEKAEDPESIFFEDIPKALNVDIKNIAASDADLSAYSVLLQEKIDELKNSYKYLVNRLEHYLAKDILGNDALSFDKYKLQLQKRYQHVKEHQLISEELSFLKRINSPIDDKESWWSSVGQALLKKRLDTISDEEELILKDKLLHVIKSLDNLLQLSNEDIDETKEEVLKVDLTSMSGGLKEHVIRISKSKIKEKDEIINRIKDLLNEDKTSKIAILTKLLREELDNE